tara:strand:- start:51555 stop:52343 length:789 start_codon:yes stop_codon:yes gene_type:complete
VSAKQRIHSTAVIHSSANIADDVEIGPYAIIGADVEIGAGSWVGPHAVINGESKFGKNNKFFQFCSVGEQPQDFSYAGEPTRLEVGDNNIFREFTTIQRGTVKDKGLTKIGNDNYFMNYVHIAHDCIIHNNTIFANSCALAGHVEVFDYAMVGALCAVHQFCRIGSYSFLARVAQVPKDVPPYLLVTGPGMELHGLNAVGLKRRGFSRESITILRKVFKLFYREGLSLKDATAEIEKLIPEDDAVKLFYDFITAEHSRGIAR